MPRPKSRPKTQYPIFLEKKEIKDLHKLFDFYIDIHYVSDKSKQRIKEIQEKIKKETLKFGF